MVQRDAPAQRGAVAADAALSGDLPDARYSSRADQPQPKPIFSRGGQLKEITKDQLLDIVYNILQLNRALLKNGSLEHEDHDAYFQQHLAILKKLIGRDKVVEPEGIAQSPGGKE
jgi:hypothetical protein